MNPSKQNLPAYEDDDVPIEEWGPTEFNECRAFAIRGRPREDVEQQRWLKAKKHLIWAYRYGYGTEPDSQRYFALLAQLAELESGVDLGAKWLLAQAFKEGIGTSPNQPEYLRWMKYAAEDDDPEAMFSLAEAYRRGCRGRARRRQVFSLAPTNGKNMSRHWHSWNWHRHIKLALERLKATKNSSKP